MVLKTCHIKLKNCTHPTFYGGDTINGDVCFTLEHQKLLKDLTFQIKGVTACRWIQNKVTYTSRIEHFRSIEISLVTQYPRNEDGEIVLGPGDHSFPFTFTLPFDIPSSFEGFLGRTRYTIKVTAKRYLSFDDTWKMLLSVVYKYDLNKNPACSRPTVGQILSKFSFLCFNRGNLIVIVTLPYIGLVSGQTIWLNCDIKNKSEVDVTQITFKLVQEISYISTLPRSCTKQLYNNITQLIGAGVNKEDEKCYPVALRIPALPPTNTTGSIQIMYYLKVKASTSGMHKNPSCRIPLIIGTIPLFYTQFVNHYRRPIVDNTRPSPTAPPFVHPTPASSHQSPKSDDPPPYHLLAPPTYEEAFTSFNMLDPHPDDRDGNTHFNPMYPVYNYLGDV